MTASPPKPDLETPDIASPPGRPVMRPRQAASPVPSRPEYVSEPLKHFSPVYQWKRVQDDIRVFWFFLKSLRVGEDPTIDLTVPMVQGKLLGCGAVAWVCSLPMMVFGSTFQYLFHDPWAGVAGGFGLALLTGSLAFQTAWYLLNRGRYRQQRSPLKASILDVLPIQLRSWAVFLLASFLHAGVSGSLIALTRLSSLPAIRNFPIALGSAAIGFLLFDGPFFRWINDFVAHHAVVLCARFHGKR